MKKRLSILALSTALLVGVFAGCGGGSGTPTTNATSQAADPATIASTAAETPSAAPVTVEFFQSKVEEGPQKGYQQIINKFQEEYPYIKIEMNTVPDAGKVLISRFAANDIPPVFTDFPTQKQFKQKVENGYIEMLTGHEFLNRVSPSALEMSRANDGNNYALPYSQNFVGVYYNIDIFTENNIEIPKTYDELIAVCEDLKSKNIAPLGLTFKDPARVGHMFQCMTIAWVQEGVERLVGITEGKNTIIGDPDFTKMAERMLELTSYANADAFGLADTGMWENFANGKYAMCITGSYTRGTILLANPNINMGVFPLPNDTDATTTLLTGIDAAICVHAGTGAAEKDAGLKFLEFLSRGENAQIWSDNEGSPSTITAAVYQDKGVQPVIDKMKAGPVHDFMAASIDNNIIMDMYNITQEFLIDKDAAQYLDNLETASKTNAQ